MRTTMAALGLCAMFDLSGCCGDLIFIPDGGPMPPGDGGRPGDGGGGGDGGGDNDGGTGFPTPPGLGAQLDRAGRPLVTTILIQPFVDPAVRDTRRSAYNGTPQADWIRFGADIRASIAAYDALNVTCGDNLLADATSMTASRYDPLAMMLVDDRIWVNTDSTTCSFFLAVELAATAVPSLAGDCGGRTPAYDPVDALYSLLTRGSATGVSDGVASDSATHSTTMFPFLADP